MSEVKIHPSHESWTGKPYHAIGDKVIFANLTGEITQVRNVGSQETAVFEYQVLFDNGETSNWIRSSDLHKV